MTLRVPFLRSSPFVAVDTWGAGYELRGGRWRKLRTFMFQVGVMFTDKGGHRTFQVRGPWRAW